MPQSITRTGYFGSRVREEDVVGLEIAMRDAALVRRGEHTRDVATKSRDDARVERAIGEARRQRHTVDELHRDPRPAIVEARRHS